MKVRLLIFDIDFLKNADDSFLENIVYLKEPIPLNIKRVVMDYIPNFNDKRLAIFGNDKHFMKQIRKERLVSRKLNPIEAREYHNDLVLDFIDKHAEFSPLIKEIKYIDV